MLELVRKNARFFLAASLAALALRLLFVLRFPGVVDDSRLYADIAMNWLQHGVYGITDSGQVVPTFSRLPGYPAFLAAIFAVFGSNNFRAVLLIQILFDLGTCLLAADLARRMFSGRAAKAAFLLAALCPFLANYSSAALTETLEIFFTALALDLAVCGLASLRQENDSSSTRTSAVWLACGLSIGGCVLLRPDGGILFAAVGGCWLLLFLRKLLSKEQRGSNPASSVLPLLRVGIILAIGAFLPLVPWTLRNLHTMHRFQPLAPRYANDSDELVMAGFNRWTKTWIADYTSVQEIYWRVPGDAIDVTRLPGRAFDSAQQRQETEQIFADYNENHDVTPELDARFAALAAARIQAAPLRYYILLPAARIADMWLRPRTELLPSDPRWWEFDDEPVWLTVSIVFGLVNLAYVAAAAAGLLRSRELSGLGLFVLFLLLRSLFLGTLENPEPRYTLECYPVVIIMAAACLSGKSNRNDQKPA
ncbi:MAG TPA: glycosyltransferase family 39 protein [Candidatus Acidoferrum sp.]|nr:glycosyltransferase family 39 protein [Candidatus Acidoferrum sp.]